MGRLPLGNGWYGAMRERQREHGDERELGYYRMFQATVWRAGLLLLAYVGCAALWDWPATALGPLRADSNPIIGINVALAAGLIGLSRIGIAAARNGDLW